MLFFGYQSENANFELCYCGGERVYVFDMSIS